jgi:hypothetical protein
MLAGADAGNPSIPIAGTASGQAGSGPAGSNAAGAAADSGAGGGAGTAGKAGGGTSGAAGGGGAIASGAGGAGGSSSTVNNLTGMLGKLGPVQPVMAGWATTNGPEFLIYLSTAPLTCAMMQTMGTKWLSTLPAGSQVMEIVTNNQYLKVGSLNIGFPTGEVNYAEGSKSSSTEVQGTGGPPGGLVYTKIVPKMVYEGTVSVTTPFTLSGSFHAEWCQGGSEY